MDNKGKARKSYWLTEEQLKQYDKLKEADLLKGERSDTEFFVRMLYYSDLVINHKVVDVNLLNEKEKEIKGVYAKIGELQGRLAELQTRIEELQTELNIYKQKALPKKSFFKRLFGID